MLDQSALRWLVAESATLWERLEGKRVTPDPDSSASNLAARRLSKWRERVAMGDESVLAARLRLDGIERGAVLAAMGPVRLRKQASLPPWAELIQEASSRERLSAERDEVVRRAELSDAGSQAAFQEILLPFVEVACSRLLRRISASRHLLRPSALRDLAHGLLDELSSIAVRTLCVEFAAYRSGWDCGLRQGATVARGSGERTIYDAFVQQRSGDRMSSWLLRYPMLGRLLGMRCEYWIASTTELIQRLDDDKEEIGRRFNLGGDGIEVRAIRTGLSDPHRCGRVVLRLEFAEDGAILYKPRSLMIDEAFRNVLEQLDKTMGSDLATALPVVLDRGDYGWVECVRSKPCRDEAAVRGYYRRAGMLACLAYALGGNDLHGGNVIAVGEHPVLIDLECIIGSLVKVGGSESRGHLASAMGSRWNVLLTGLPPVARPAAHGVFRVVGGLGDPSVEPIVVRRGRCVNQNTDWMQWRADEPEYATFSDDSMPALNGDVQPASRYVGDVLGGFSELYQCLEQPGIAKEALRELDRQRFRVVVRDTETYWALIGAALAPHHLTSGVDWSIALDVVTAPVEASVEYPCRWPTRRAEREELERLDVPCFYGSKARPKLVGSSGAELQEILEHRTVDERLRGLSEADSNTQRLCLEMAFDVSRSKLKHRGMRVGVGLGDGRALTREKLFVELSGIVDLLRSAAREDEAGGVCWNGWGHADDAEDEIGPVGRSLFSGTTGVALFLAAAALVVPEVESGPLARRLVDRVAGEVREEKFDVGEYGIGGGVGLGGIVYALVTIGALLGEDGCFEAARVASERVTARMIEKDEELDVMSGVAGLLLGLLSEYQVSGDRMVLRRAEWCGRHLLDARSMDSESGVRIWRTRFGVRKGFAHGAAGIAYALHRLYLVTGREDHRRGASEGLAFAKTGLGAGGAFGQKRQGGKQDALAPSWCNGSAGVMLARAACEAEGDGRRGLEEEMGRVAWGVNGAGGDSLCCGKLGQAELLLYSGRRLGRPKLCEDARMIGARVVAGALARGSYALRMDDGYCPGFFQGISGVGYQLMRLVEPAVLPSVLLWE